MLAELEYWLLSCKYCRLVLVPWTSRLHLFVCFWTNICNQRMLNLTNKQAWWTWMLTYVQLLPNGIHSLDRQVASLRHIVNLFHQSPSDCTCLVKHICCWPAMWAKPLVWLMLLSLQMLLSCRCDLCGYLFIVPVEALGLGLHKGSRRISMCAPVNTSVEAMTT